MISFDSFVMEDGMPIYLQILLFLKRGVIAGAVADGDELPSRRVLSALLGDAFFHVVQLGILK